jgi:hypothetical protein
MSGRILASIDAARALLERHGHELIGPVIEATEKGRAALVAAGIDVIDGEYIDPLKLVILLSSCGADGNKVEADLLAANIDIEMANRDILIPMITFADTPDRIDDLVSKIIDSVNSHRGEARSIEILPAFSIEPEVVVTPREAFFSGSEVVAAEDAVGRPHARRRQRALHRVDAARGAADGHKAVGRDQPTAARRRRNQHRQDLTSSRGFRNNARPGSTRRHRHPIALGLPPQAQGADDAR